MNNSLEGGLILPVKERIWVLDDLQSSWVLEVENSGKIWFNQTVFKNVFDVFSLNIEEYQWYIKKYVECLLEIKPTSISRKNTNYKYMITEILNNKEKYTNQWSLKNRYGFAYYVVKRYLDFKKITNIDDVRVNDYSPRVLEF